MLSDFVIQNRLGSGSFGTVFKGVRKHDGLVCVIKEINLRCLDNKQRSDALNEGLLLKQLDNQYVVKYYDMFIEKEFLYIVMEHCENGDLRDYIRRNSQLKESVIWMFFLQMLIGLHYIHSKNILHRDFKTMNIFLTNSANQLRIGDLGVAKLVNAMSLAHTVVGTPFFLSPEICESKPYNAKSDVWSLGCIVYELCTGKHPFEAATQAELIPKILKAKWNAIPQHYSSEINLVIGLMLTKEPAKRPDTKDLLNHPIIKEKLEQLNMSVATALNETKGGSRRDQSPTSKLTSDKSKKKIFSPLKTSTPFQSIEHSTIESPTRPKEGGIKRTQSRLIRRISQPDLQIESISQQRQLSPSIYKPNKGVVNPPKMIIQIKPTQVNIIFSVEKNRIQSFPSMTKITGQFPNEAVSTPPQQPPQLNSQKKTSQQSLLSIVIPSKRIQKTQKQDSFISQTTTISPLKQSPSDLLTKLKNGSNDQSQWGVQHIQRKNSQVNIFNSQDQLIQNLKNQVISNMNLVTTYSRSHRKSSSMIDIHPQLADQYVVPKGQDTMTHAKKSERSTSITFEKRINVISNNNESPSHQISPIIDGSKSPIKNQDRIPTAKRFFAKKQSNTEITSENSRMNTINQSIKVGEQQLNSRDSPTGLILPLIKSSNVGSRNKLMQPIRKKQSIHLMPVQDDISELQEMFRISEKNPSEFKRKMLVSHSQTLNKRGGQDNFDSQNGENHAEWWSSKQQGEVNGTRNSTVNYFSHIEIKRLKEEVEQLKFRISETLGEHNFRSFMIDLSPYFLNQPNSKTEEVTGVLSKWIQDESFNTKSQVVQLIRKMCELQNLEDQINH